MFGQDKTDEIETLPMVPLRDVVVFPHMMIPFVIGRPSSIKALDHALARGKRIFLSAQHDATHDNPAPADHAHPARCPGSPDDPAQQPAEHAARDQAG